MVGQLLAFRSLLIVVESESLDFLQIVAVSLSESNHFLVNLRFLRQECLVSLMLHVQVGFRELAFLRPFGDVHSVAVKLSIQIGILLSTVFV
jgi:hypothetical protein